WSCQTSERPANSRSTTATSARCRGMEWRNSTKFRATLTTRKWLCRDRASDSPAWTLLGATTILSGFIKHPPSGLRRKAKLEMLLARSWLLRIARRIVEDLLPCYLGLFGRGFIRLRL